MAALQAMSGEASVLTFQRTLNCRQVDINRTEGSEDFLVPFSHCLPIYCMNVLLNVILASGS